MLLLTVRRDERRHEVVDVSQCLVLLVILVLGEPRLALQRVDYLLRLLARVVYDLHEGVRVVGKARLLVVGAADLGVVRAEDEHDALEQRALELGAVLADEHGHDLEGHVRTLHEVREALEEVRGELEAPVVHGGMEGPDSIL